MIYGAILWIWMQHGRHAQQQHRRHFSIALPLKSSKWFDLDLSHALRLESGNFSWGSEGISRKTRALTVVYNASNNELVRTNTLVKGAVIQIDATPFRQWYESHYAITLGKKSADAAVSIYAAVWFRRE